MCRSWGREWCSSSAAGPSSDRMSTLEPWTPSGGSPSQRDKQLHVDENINTHTTIIIIIIIIVQERVHFA